MTLTDDERRACASADARLRAMEREEAAALIASRGYAYYCRGAGWPRAYCTTLEDWDDATAGRPARASVTAGH